MAATTELGTRREDISGVDIPAQIPFEWITTEQIRMEQKTTRVDTCAEVIHGVVALLSLYPTYHICRFHLSG